MPLAYHLDQRSGICQYTWPHHNDCGIDSYNSYLDNSYHNTSPFKKINVKGVWIMAEGVGFEPTDPVGSPVF